MKQVRQRALGEVQLNTLEQAAELTREIEARFPPADAAEFLKNVALGRDPADPDKKDGGPPIDWAARRWAFCEILNRGYGKQKSHLVLEGDVGVAVRGRIDQTIAISVLDGRDYLNALAPSELDKYRETERKLLAAAKQKVIDLEQMHVENAGGRDAGHFSKKGA